MKVIYTLKLNWNDGVPEDVVSKTFEGIAASCNVKGLVLKQIISVSEFLARLAGMLTRNNDANHMFSMVLRSENL